MGTDQMFTSSECRAQAEEKIAQAECEPKNKRRLLTAAQAWLTLADQMQRLEGPVRRNLLHETFENTDGAGYPIGLNSSRENLQTAPDCPQPQPRGPLFWLTLLTDGDAWNSPCSPCSKAGRAAVAGGHALADAVSPCAVDSLARATNTREKIPSRSSATGTRSKPSSCRSSLHDLQDRMGEFQLARRGDHSPRNNII